MKALYCKICERPVTHLSVDAHLINCEARQYGYQGFIGNNSAIDWHVKIFSPEQSNMGDPALLYIYKNLQGLYTITEDRQFPSTNRVYQANTLSHVLLLVQHVLESQ